jgi:sugar phosphate isomerase/epimerase
MVVATVTLALLGAQAATPQVPAAGRDGDGGRGGRAVPSVSVRPSDMRMFRTAAARVLGWNVGIASSVFSQLSFSDAAANVDALGFSSLQGSSSQKVSVAIPKNLDENLLAEEITAVKNRLAELRLRMPSYRVASLPADESSLRKMLEFAKGLGVETVVCDAAPASLAALDKLAGQIDLFRVARYRLKAVHHRLLRERAFADWRKAVRVC